jgi:glycosyltransferase involved in cell wall biosynthesis
MRDPLVSVVVAVHDGERFLAEALDSVLAQEYRPLELIVVDDGSMDRSADVARDRGACVIRQEQQGLAAARNTGLLAARGELVAFNDADDVWLPGKLRRQVDYLRERPDLDFVYTAWTILLEPGATLPPQWERDGTGRRDGFLPSSFLARRDVFDRVGLFDTRYEIGEDVDWFTRAAEAGVRYDVVPSVLVRYRVHGANLTRDTQALRNSVFRALREAAARRRARVQ